MTERVAVVVPAYNAARSVGAVVTDALRQLPLVIVIDDGSVDGTGDAAREAGAQVLRHAINRGKGAALKTGFAWALKEGCDGVITMDADGQHLPSEISKILACHERSGADIIIGGRAHLFEQMLPRRRRANRFSAWAIANASRANITDSQSGFRYYSARLMREVSLKANGFNLESEVIVQAGLKGLRIETTPIELGFVDGISTSHYRPFMDTVRIALTVIRVRLFG